MYKASISHYHQPEAFTVSLWLVCLSLVLSGRRYPARKASFGCRENSVRRVLWISRQCGPADRNSCFLSARAYLLTQLCSPHRGTSERFTGRVKLTRDLHKRHIIRKDKELLPRLLWAVLGENPITGALLNRVLTKRWLVFWSRWNLTANI